MEIFTILSLFVLGICIGSFLNVLADRLSNDEPITGRSRCDACQKQLHWHELVPIVSFFIQKRQCRGCKTRLSWWYPLAELATGLAFVAVYVFFPSGFFSYVYARLPLPDQLMPMLWWNGVFDSVAGGESMLVTWLVMIVLLILVSGLIVILLADLKYFIIPDQIQILLAGGALVLIVLEGVVGGTWQHLNEHLLASVLIMAPMMFLFVITKGKGMGFGDVKLAAVIGLLVGIRGGIITLYVAFLTGTIVGVVLMLLRRYGLKSMVPFGPFLVLGLIAVIWWYPELFVFTQTYFYFDIFGW